jgi:hypothetical protein
MAMLISPSAVWIGFGRVPLRDRHRGRAFTEGSQFESGRAMSSSEP